jgi:hypothetical protein
MASPGFQALVDDLFGKLSKDSISRPYKPEDRDAEAAKIARLRQLRLAKGSGTGAVQIPKGALLAR